MNAERWREVKRVLLAALEIPLAERPAVLAAQCGGDTALRHEVETLLAAHDDLDAHEEPARLFVADRSLRTVHGALATEVQQLRTRVETGLADDFDILGVLGEGGMGSVFLAQERSLGRTVAIKVLRPDRAARPGSRERFHREARIAAQLSHLGIVPLYSFGEVDGLWYFVMEYVRGPSLAERLESEGRLPPGEVRRIMLAMAGALEHAHSRGVVHRDIKPANILMDETSDEPRLADFGISKFDGAPEQITLTGAIVGTPLFMSPEQSMDGGQVDARSDLYSLGAVAYAMLTGRAPITGNSAVDVLSRRQLEDPVPLRELAPGLPTDFAYIVMRCLERDPDQRWPDAGALQNALRNSGNVHRSELPMAIADLPGYAAYALTWLILWGTFAFSSDRGLTSRLLLMLLAVLVPIGTALHFWRVREHGVRFRQLLRLVGRPPRWWGAWWPRRLRGPDDLWPLLPPVARLVRCVITLAFVALAFVALMADRTAAPFDVAQTVALAVLLVIFPATVLLALFWIRQQRMSLDHTIQFFLASTVSSTFWREPAIAKLLSSSAASVRPPDAAVTADHARAVEELVRRFPSTLEPVGRTALRAVQHRLAGIARIEREMAILARDTSPVEINRLNARLAGLSASESLSADHRALIDTVQQEIDLVRKIQGQHTLAVAKRSAQVAELRALWTQLTALVDAERQGDAMVRMASERVQALCTHMMEPTTDAHGSRQA